MYECDDADRHHHHRPPSAYSSAPFGGGGAGYQRPAFGTMKQFSGVPDQMDSPQMEVFSVAGIKRSGPAVPFFDGAGQSAFPASVADAMLWCPAALPRCQVDGCPAALHDAKDYHRRHKVCEMHSKAPQAVVLGVVQRFCQQCSRFHAVTEFDEAKRSCRRRLAGHNERRRKTFHESLSRNPSQGLLERKWAGGRCSYSSRAAGQAHSLLSRRAASWGSPAELASRSSAALQELIEEHRAAALERQLLDDCEGQFHHRGWHGMSLFPHKLMPPQPQPQPLPDGWEGFHDGSGGHVTLDLMQASSTTFGPCLIGGASIDSGG